MGGCSGEKVMVLCDVMRLWGGVWSCVFVGLEWSIGFREGGDGLEEVTFLRFLFFLGLNDGSWEDTFPKRVGRFGG